MRVSRTLHRTDGSILKIVGEMFFNLSLEPQFSYFVLRQANEQDAPRVLSKTPASSFQEMSRADYLSKGRSEVMQYVTSAEILSVIVALKQSVTEPVTP